MIVEVFQLLKLIAEGVFYYLPIHMLCFVMFPLILRLVKVKGFSNAHSLSRDRVKVSVVIPEYNENLDVFEECLKSVFMNRPDEVIIVHDDSRNEIRELAMKYGAKVYSFPRKVGKRVALAKGWELASGDIIVHVDSDVRLCPNAIDEIVKPFEDELVVGVQGRNLVRRSGSWFAYRLSSLIEMNRDINNRVLNGCLVVVDGRFNAWRRSWLLSQKEAFLNEIFLGRRCEIGDDRFLTQRANIQGYKTVYQPTALAETIAPETYLKFIKQQLRWLRSGYKFFYTDFKLGIIRRAPPTYLYFQSCYYLGPISFTAAMIYDVLFTPPVLHLPWWGVIPLAVVGSSTIAVIRRLAVGFFNITPKEFVMLGFHSLFVAYPLMLFALMTVRKQGAWISR